MTTVPAPTAPTPSNPLAALRAPDPTTPVVTDPNSQNSLDQNAFLRIFLEQLKNQDPLNPQDSTQLSAQLAQFSQLEQSVQSTAVLHEISGKLDQLIAAKSSAQNTATSTLDPVGLIGKQIDFPGDQITLPASGTSPPLQIPLADSPASTALLIEAKPLGGGPSGLLSISTRRDASGQFPGQPAGNYQLWFDNGAPALQGPDGIANVAVDVSPFQALTTAADGSEVLSQPPQPFTFAPGESYTFTVRSSDSSGGAPTPIDLSRSAVVTGVRIRNGAPVLVAGGAEVDLSQIQGVQP
jgi:hypothetical protein